MLAPIMTENDPIYQGSKIRERENRRGGINAEK